MGEPLDKLISWLVQEGLAGATQEHLLQGYCEKLVDIGLVIQRVHVAQKALHPVYGSIGFDWYRDKGVSQEQYEHTAVPREKWTASPLYHLLKSGESELRERLFDSDKPHRFPFLDQLRSIGATDYFAVAVRFGRNSGDDIVDPDNPPEGFLISWTTDKAKGFSDQELTTLRHCLPALGLALKAAANRQMADCLLPIYLGSDAGARVLSGRIQRGSLETIHSAILYFDLQGFTKLTEANPPAAVIEMLNDYFGQVVSAIEDNDGNVLKFMGDGLLAIFHSSDHQLDCLSATEAAVNIRDVMADTNKRRDAEQLCHTGFGLAVHEGNVEYGNIGADNRLDFTVIGSAVNKTARIQGMCRSLEQELILSASVAQAVSAHRGDLVSLGIYMLRGVPNAQELFTVYRTSD